MLTSSNFYSLSNVLLQVIFTKKMFCIMYKLLQTYTSLPNSLPTYNLNTKLLNQAQRCHADMHVSFYTFSYVKPFTVILLFYTLHLYMVIKIFYWKKNYQETHT